MAAKKNTKSTWTAIRQHLKSLESDALIALIKDLHDSSPTNRNFLRARVSAAEGGADSLESYRKRVTEPFYPLRGEAKLKLGEARKAIREYRKAIREYRKATSNIPGTIELLLTYVEAGTRFTNENGDIDERFYDSLSSALGEMAALLKKEKPSAWLAVEQRLAKLDAETHFIGWGYGDHVSWIYEGLLKHFSKPI